MCYAFTCDVIVKSSFTPRFVHLPLVPSRGEFNPAIGKIYPRATFTPSSCIRGISFFKFTPTIPLGFVHTPGWCIRPMALSTVSNAFEKSKKTLITLSPLSRTDTIVSIGSNHGGICSHPSPKSKLVFIYDIMFVYKLN